MRPQIAAALSEVNARLSPIERIRRFALIDEPFTLENGMLTPTLKIRRHLIRDRYAAILDALYEEKPAHTPAMASAE